MRGKEGAKERGREGKEGGMERGREGGREGGREERERGGGGDEFTNPPPSFKYATEENLLPGSPPSLSAAPATTGSSLGVDGAAATSCALSAESSPPRLRCPLRLDHSRPRSDNRLRSACAVALAPLSPTAGRAALSPIRLPSPDSPGSGHRRGSPNLNTVTARLNRTRRTEGPTRPRARVPARDRDCSCGRAPIAAECTSGRLGCAI